MSNEFKDILAGQNLTAFSSVSTTPPRDEKDIQADLQKAFREADKEKWDRYQSEWRADFGYNKYIPIANVNIEGNTYRGWSFNQVDFYNVNTMDTNKKDGSPAKTTTFDGCDFTRSSLTLCQFQQNTVLENTKMYKSVIKGGTQIEGTFDNFYINESTVLGASCINGSVKKPADLKISGSDISGCCDVNGFEAKSGNSIVNNGTLKDITLNNKVGESNCYSMVGDSHSLTDLAKPDKGSNLPDVKEEKVNHFWDHIGFPAGGDVRGKWGGGAGINNFLIEAEIPLKGRSSMLYDNTTSTGSLTFDGQLHSYTYKQGDLKPGVGQGSIGLGYSGFGAYNDEGRPMFGYHIGGSLEIIDAGVGGYDKKFNAPGVNFSVNTLLGDKWAIEAGTRLSFLNDKTEQIDSSKNSVYTDHSLTNMRSVIFSSATKVESLPQHFYGRVKYDISSNEINSGCFIFADINMSTPLKMSGHATKIEGRVTRPDGSIVLDGVTTNSSMNINAPSQTFISVGVVFQPRGEGGRGDGPKFGR